MPEFSKFRWHEVAVRMTKGTTARVAGVMFDRANMDGTKVYVNNEKLAAELGCSTKSVERATRELVKTGLVYRERRESHSWDSRWRMVVHHVTRSGTRCRARRRGQCA